MPVDIGRVFEWASVASGAIGSIFIAHRNPVGYKIFLAGFLPSAAFAVYYRHWGLLMLYTYYAGMNSYGLYRWRRYDGK